MALKVGDNTLITLDDNSKKAYILSAVIFAERESRFRHADSLHQYLGELFPNLQIDYKTTLDLLRTLAKDGVLTREVIDGDDPIYGFNPEYLKPKK